MSSVFPDCNCHSGENCTCGKRFGGNELWADICRIFDEEKEKAQNYMLRNNKNVDAPVHPFVNGLECEIAPLLKNAMLSTLEEAEKQNSLDRQRTDFDCIDHISKYIWEHNPDYPERLNKYENIHDIDWVRKYLEQKPRPFFPFHLIWSNEFAAIKIQSYLRGYWIRKQERVQEVRKFWKQLKEEAQGSGTSISRRFYMVD